MKRPPFATPAVIAAILLLALTSPGCAKRLRPEPTPAKLDFARELPPGAVALRKVSPGEWPDFGAGLREAGNVVALRVAVDHGLDYLSRPSSRAAYPYLDITHDRAVATLLAMRELLQDEALLADPARLPAAIAQRFDVYKSVGAPAADGSGYTGKVLFTGYFTPTYEANPVRTEEYRWPLYRRPSDLVVDTGGETLGRRNAEGGIIPYFTRAEIEGGGVLAGKEIAWLKDRWEAYVVTVQGSARLRYRTGHVDEIGYAGHNGHAYASPAMKMVEDGVIRREDVSAETLRNYFRAHPEAMDKYLWHNPRTVFFTERPGGPFGSLNVPVTPLATIATDKKVYPPAMPAFVDTRAVPGRAGSRGWKQFMLDQDTGGAIRAAGRCDLYIGAGEQAEWVAGQQLSEGVLYYLAVKQELVIKYVEQNPTVN